MTRSVTVALGSSPDLDGVATSRVGHDFAGWWLPDGDLGTDEDDTPLTAATVWTRLVLDGTHVVVYARWTPRSYTVELNALGGRVDAPTTLVVTFGAVYGPLPQATRTGFRLLSWRSGYDAAADQTTGAAFVPGATGTWSTPADVTLYAEWEAVRTTLVLRPGAGASVLGQPQAVVTATYGTPLTDLPRPERPGYDFTGWWTDPDGGRQVSAGTVWADPASSVDLHAHWRVRVLNVQVLDGTGRTLAPGADQVTLVVTKGGNDACAGAAQADVVCVDHGSRLADSGADAAVTGPSGWGTSGWGVLREGSWEQFDLTGERVRSDLVVAATWVPATFQVTLLAGGAGADVPSTDDLAAGTNPWHRSGSSVSGVAYTGRLVDALPVGSLAPTATGFAFTGWTCVVGPCPVLDGAATMPAADLTWRATWSRDAYRVEYHLNLPDGVVTDRVRVDAPTNGGTVAYGSVVPTPAGYAAPVVAGLDLEGWRTADGVVVVPGETTAPASPGGVLDLVAAWSTARLTVTFDLGTAPPGTSDDDFTTGPQAVQTPDGTAYAAPQEFTTYGLALSADDRPDDPLAAPYSHVFMGWSPHPVATGPDDFYRFGADDPVTQSTVLYAQWQRREFTVSFDTNPGAGQDGRPKAVPGPHPVAAKVAYGDTVDEVDPPVAEGFWLTGWNTAADGSGTAFSLGDAGTRVTGPATLYAQWGNLGQALAFAACGLIGVGAVGGAGWYSRRRRHAPLSRRALLDPADPRRDEIV
ncbi:InlB B-repeat-containing protein [Pengzhenrongella phosphoraccumulans]|uniref:InlB B-repeat-containing protein n=1 Tax=Pengzhenrongella phosphoraccumulans TaxID=3114394 RepID=UPI00388FF2E7